MHSANKEMGSTDESYSNTSYEPKAYYLVETDVESLTESLTQPQFSEQRFLEDVDYDDASLGEMLHNAHREHVYHSHDRAGGGGDVDQVYDAFVPVVALTHTSWDRWMLPARWPSA